MLSEQKAIEDFGSTVSNILKSSNLKCTSSSQHLKEFLKGNGEHVMYKFDVRYWVLSPSTLNQFQMICSEYILFARSSTFIDSKGGMHEVDAEDFSTSKADSLSKRFALCQSFPVY